VYFTLAEDYGGTRRKKPSAFLYELGVLEPPVGAEKKKPPLPVREFQPTPKQKEEAAKYLSREKQYSFTKLSTYNDCPWKYRYAFVLQVPKRGSYALSYGSSMHKTLQNFFTLWQQRAIEKKSSEALVSLTELLTIYQQAFIDEWYTSKKQRQEYYSKGEKALTSWYVQTTKSIPNVVRLEQIFNLKVDEFVINGAIDRIDRIGGSDEAPEYKIVDYKTGKVKKKFETDDSHSKYRRRSRWSTLKD
jgi:DNA helicase-2/ATP-dependent DNA helicase PcrA